MSIKLTAESFLNVVKQSGLIEKDRLKQLVQECLDRGVDVKSSRAIADQLVALGVVTRWQVEKLLQGKHKGFMLGRYRLLDLLGKGGMSSVYLAEQTLLRRRCAIKVLPTKRVDDSSYLARFYREAQAVAALDHPNIVRAYDVGQEVDKDAQIHFLVMEFVDGQSMQGLVQNSGPLGFVVAAEYFRQAALGLHHAHQSGLVHRDIKPGNLLVDNKGLVKLLDLGLARFFAEDDENSLTVAHDEKVLGTADYLAPEQALDSHSVDIRADIYSLGCAMYFVLTGHPPFNEGTLAQRLMCHQTKEPPPITQDRPDAPPSLLAIISKMMRKQREDRYQTAQEVADVLAGWLAQSAAPQSAKQPQPPPVVAAVVMPAAPLLSTAITASESAATQFATVLAEPLPAAQPVVRFTAPLAVPVETSGTWPPGTLAPSETADSGVASFLFGLHGDVDAVLQTTPPVAPPVLAKPAASAAQPAVAIPVLAPVPPSGLPPVAAAPRVAAVPIPGEQFTPEDFGAVPTAELAWDESALPWLTPAEPPPAAVALPASAELRQARPVVAVPVRAVPVAPAAPVAPASIPMALPVEVKKVVSNSTAVPPAAAVAPQPPTALPAALELPWAFDVGEDEPIAEDGFDFLSPTIPSTVAPTAAPTAAPVVAPEWNPSSSTLSAANQTLPVPNFAASVAEDESQPPWSVPSTPTASSTAVAKKSHSRRPLIIVNAVVGVVLLLVVASVAVKTFSGSGANGTSAPASGNGTHVASRTVAADLRVGPGAQFSTLGEALAHVKQHRSEYKDQSPDFRLVIGVAGGSTYPERINLDNSKHEYPNGLAIIAEGEQPAILSSNEQGPIVKLTGIDRLRLEGLTFSGSFGTSGVELSGPGSNSHITVTGCRFSSDVGVMIRSNTSNVSIRESIFDTNRLGIQFEGPKLEHKDLLVGNNSFFRVVHSISFSHMPATTSSGLAFRRNLFAGCTSIELAVEAGYDATQFAALLSPQGLGAELNWSDLKLDSVAPDEFDLIGNPQQRVKLTFASIERNTKVFLAPAAKSPHQGLPSSSDGLKPFAGAVAP